MSHTHLFRVAAVAGGTFLLAATLRAGPPFLTDDPEPVDLHHWELYVFGQGDRTSEGDTIAGPALELNYGAAPNTQLHLVLPYANVSTPGTGWTRGLGDTEFGVKYRFLDETDSRPQVGVFPMAEVATGSSDRGLGNGRTWYRLPLWIQKSWGSWTTYGGGGVALNAAAGARDYGFGGWLLQHDVGKSLTFGGELFGQGPDTDGGRGFVAANAGGYVKISDSFNLLFSAGHSVSGARHTLWYLGLYWTWGPEEREKK